MRIAIFGANGPTGRLLTEQSLAAGYDTLAVTRQPAGFPVSGTSTARLQVVGADVLDPQAVDAVVEASDAVLSTLGGRYGKAPVEVYSHGVGNILDAMKRYDVRRLAVVSSGAVTGEKEPTGGFFFNHVLLPYVTKRLGRTLYDDMRRMEELVARSDVDWTILRPSGLFGLPAVTAYSLTEEHGPGRFTARVDLADALLRQVSDDRFVGKVGHVITTQDNPSLLSVLRHEAFAR